MAGGGGARGAALRGASRVARSLTPPLEPRMIPYHSQFHSRGCAHISRRDFPRGPAAAAPALALARGAPAAREAPRVAAAVAAQGAAGPPKAFAVSKAVAPFKLARPAPLFSTESEKIELALRANQAARAKDPRVKQVQVTLADTAKAILIANS